MAHPSSRVDSRVAELVTRAPVYHDKTFSRPRDPPVSKNIVCTIDFNIPIDPLKLVELYPHCEYDSTRFAALIARIMPPKSCALIFGTGRSVLTGCRTLHEVEVGVRKFAQMLHDTGHPVVRYAFSITNHVMTASVPYSLDLARMHRNNLGISDYDKRKFPGIIFKLTDLKVAVMCFESGKFNIVGFRNYHEGLAAHDYVMNIIPRYRLVNVLGPTKRKENGKAEKLLVSGLLDPSSAFDVRTAFSGDSDKPPAVNILDKVARFVSPATTAADSTSGTPGASATGPPARAKGNVVIRDDCDNCFNIANQDDSDEDSGVPGAHESPGTPAVSGAGKRKTPPAGSGSPTATRRKLPGSRFHLGEISRKDQDVRFSGPAGKAGAGKASVGTGPSLAPGKQILQRIRTAKQQKDSLELGRELYLKHRKLMSRPGQRPGVSRRPPVPAPVPLVADGEKARPSAGTGQPDRFRELYAEQQAAASKRAVPGTLKTVDAIDRAVRRGDTGFKRQLVYTSDAIDADAISRARKRAAGTKARPSRVIIN
jgi:TATA-box binding protein (TBP) (component of TFIID and TFIIIB)